MYYPELSHYTYSKNEPNVYPVLNVGWLDSHHPYPKGEVTQLFLDRLWVYCRCLLRMTLGYHPCDFCDQAYGVTIYDGKDHYNLGSAQIRVIGNDIVYAAPNMIYHYIRDHKYLPPEEFIAAVLEQPLPHESPSYRTLYPY